MNDGKFRLEERPVRESDWFVQGMEAAKPLTTTVEGDNNASSDSVAANNNNVSAPSSPKKELDPKLRKAAFNAPKRIKKLESMIAENETKIIQIDDQMSQHGKDVEKLMDMNTEKQGLQEKIDSYMQEWNELEDLLAQVAEVTAE